MTTRSNRGGSAPPSKPQAAAAPAPAAAPSPAAASAAPARASGTAPMEVLLGSSFLPALVEIAGASVQLGVVVAAAHAASGMSTSDWNALTEDARDERIDAELANMRKAADDAAAAEAWAQAERESAMLEARERKQREDAAAADAECAREAAAREEAENAGFPCVISVGNNSGISLAEPVSGAYIPAGGTGNITLLNRQHAHEVRENLKAILAQNYLSDSVLTIEKLPA